MRLNLTLPGWSSGSKNKNKGDPFGRNKGTKVDKDGNKLGTKKDPADEAEEIFKASVNPYEANTSLYQMYTRGGAARTQDKTMTGASDTLNKSGTSNQVTGSNPRGSSPGLTPTDVTMAGGANFLGDRSDSWKWGRSALGNVSRALKKLTGG